MAKLNESKILQGQYIQANGLNIYYEEFGSGEPLILLHGGLGTGELQWGSLIPTLSSDFRVIIPDARSHGKTGGPSEAIHVSDLGDDVSALIAALQLDQPYLCGWSMGGDTALDVAIRYPDQVKRIVAGGVSCKVSEAYLDGLAEIGVEGPGVVNPEKTKKALPGLVEMMAEIHAPGPDHWITILSQLSDEMIKPPIPSHEELKSIQVPTLIIFGDRDDFIPVEDVVEFFRLIPNAELAIVPNADHHVVLSHPKLFASFVKDFLLC